MFHKPSLTINEKAEVEVESKPKIIQNDNKDESNHLKPSIDIKEKVEVESKQKIIENDNKDKEKSEVEDEAKQKIAQDFFSRKDKEKSEVESATETLESENTTEKCPDVCPLIAPKLGE